MGAMAERFCARARASLYGILCRMLWVIVDVFSSRATKLFEQSGVASRRAELLSTVVRGGSVLELGAGTGATLASGAYAGAPGRFGAVVRAETELCLRNESNEDSLFVDECLPILSGNLQHASFDAVAAFFALGEIAPRDLPVAVASCANALRPGGRLLFIDAGVAANAPDTHAFEPGRAEARRRERVARSCGHAMSPKWFLEWIRDRWKRQAKRDVEILLNALRNCALLEEGFVSTLLPAKGHTAPVVYGTFVRRSGE